MATTHTRVVVIGGGQTGLAAGYYLRRAGLEYMILDDQPAAGGSWRDHWPSLHLFSPAAHSRLPGWPMPPSSQEFPPGSHVVGYLSAYEQRYELPVRRPVSVTAVRRNGSGYRIDTTAGSWSAQAVINATGTWSRPFWPTYPGMRSFRGRQIHTAQYDGPVPPSRARSVTARCRRNGTVLAFTGGRWPTVDLHLDARVTAYRGLEPGYGRITGVDLEVRATTRGLQPRRRTVTLSGRGGRVDWSPAAV